MNFNDPGGLQRQAPDCRYTAGYAYGAEGFYLIPSFLLCYADPVGGSYEPPPDPAKDVPQLGGEVTKDQQKKFGAAAQTVIDKLTKNKPCAGLFGDKGLTTFESATFTYAVAFIDGTAIADTDKIAPTEVKNGVPTGNVTINMVGSFFNSSPSSALSDSQFRAFVLLHELGHLTGKLGDDRESAGEAGRTAADAFNKSIFENCFGLKVQ